VGRGSYAWGRGISKTRLTASILTFYLFFRFVQPILLFFAQGHREKHLGPLYGRYFKRSKRWFNRSEMYLHSRGVWCFCFCFCSNLPYNGLYVMLDCLSKEMDILICYCIGCGVEKRSLIDDHDCGILPNKPSPCHAYTKSTQCHGFVYLLDILK